MPITLPVRPSRLVLCLLVALAGCSGGDKAKTASQVAVKVNGAEVSIHQVNAQLARAQGVPAERQDQVRKQVVDGLIDQQLLIAQAVERKLDRDPEVLSAIEQSRAQILAQAFVQKTLGSQAKPGEDEIRKYYAENPALFSQRRIYRLQELATDMSAERADELKRVVASAKTLAEVATWLQKNKFQVAANTAVRGAEQLPLPQPSAISAMKDGDLGVFASDRKLTVLQVLASQAQPIDETRATPLIEQYLVTRKREELARNEIKRLRDSAKIEYVGEFVKLASLDAASPAALAAPAAPAVPGAVAAPAAPATTSTAGPTAVDKGVAGLR